MWYWCDHGAHMWCCSSVFQGTAQGVGVWWDTWKIRRNNRLIFFFLLKKKGKKDRTECTGFSVPEVFFPHLAKRDGACVCIFSTQRLKIKLSVSLIVKGKKSTMIFSFGRCVSLRVVPAGSFTFVPDSSLDRYLLQTPCEWPSALHRLGTNHHGDGHQQVGVTRFRLKFSKTTSVPINDDAFVKILKQTVIQILNRLLFSIILLIRQSKRKLTVAVWNEPLNCFPAPGGPSFSKYCNVIPLYALVFWIYAQSCLALSEVFFETCAPPSGVQPPLGVGPSSWLPQSLLLTSCVQVLSISLTLLVLCFTASPIFFALFVLLGVKFNTAAAITEKPVRGPQVVFFYLRELRCSLSLRHFPLQNVVVKRSTSNIHVIGSFCCHLILMSLCSHVNDVLIEENLCVLMSSFSIGGLILDKTVSDPNLAGIIVYAPVINGELLLLFKINPNSHYYISFVSSLSPSS